SSSGPGPHRLGAAPPGQPQPVQPDLGGQAPQRRAPLVAGTRWSARWRRPGRPGRGSIRAMRALLVAVLLLGPGPWAGPGPAQAAPGDRARPVEPEPIAPKPVEPAPPKPAPGKPKPVRPKPVPRPGGPAPKKPV